MSSPSNSSEASTLNALEKDLRVWLSTVVEEDLGESDLVPRLRDGKVLLKLIQHVNPSASVVFREGTPAVAGAENISQFLHECRSLGVPDSQLFRSEDIVEYRPSNKPRLLQSLQAIAESFAQRGWVPPLPSAEREHGLEVEETLGSVVRSGSQIVTDRADASSLRMIESLIRESQDDFAGFVQRPSVVERAFEFEVLNPERVKGEGRLDRPYWVYTIKARCFLPQYGGGSGGRVVEAVRRYRDFEWLREQFLDQFPGVVVPPIPPKSTTVSLAKFVGGAIVDDRGIVEFRQRALTKFLNRVGCVPALASSSVLQRFLESDQAAITAERKGGKPPADAHVSDESGSAAHSAAAAAAGASLNIRFRTLGYRLKDLTMSVGSALKVRRDSGTAGDRLASSSSASASASGAAGDADAGGASGDGGRDWLDATGDYAALVLQRFLALEDRANELAKRRRTLGVHMSQFGTALSHLGQLEKEYNQGPLGNALDGIGQLVQPVREGLDEQSDAELLDVAETAVFYQGLVNAIREQVDRVSSLRLTHHFLSGDLEQKQQRRDALQYANKDVSKIDADIKTLSDKVTAVREVLTAMEDVFRNELERFHIVKQEDMRHLMGSFVRIQLQSAQTFKKFWEDMLPAIERLRGSVE